MSNDVKFIKEPGYVYDLFFLFILHFNKDFVLKDNINYNKSKEDTKYFEGLLSDFSPVSDELLPFFYLKENSTSFMSQYYFHSYEKDFLDNYNLDFIQKALSDYDSVILNMLNYYFEDITKEEIEKYKASVISIKNLINKSKYSGDVKSSLYTFFLDPVPVIQKLSYELMSKDFLLKQKYEKNFENIVKFQNEFDFDSFFSKLKELKNYDKINTDNEKIYISVTSLSKNCINISLSDGKIILILGTDSNIHLDYLKSKNLLPDIDVFFNALAEKNRVKILELIYKKGEITIRDLEQTFGFTGTNSYYHLSMMIKADIIKSRNQGRVVFYSINKGCFDVVCDMLSKYSNQSKGNLSNENVEKSEHREYSAEPFNWLY